VWKVACRSGTVAANGEQSNAAAALTKSAKAMSDLASVSSWKLGY
jgi:hypothetical protein